MLRKILFFLLVIMFTYHTLAPGLPPAPGKDYRWRPGRLLVKVGPDSPLPGLKASLTIDRVLQIKYRSAVENLWWDEHSGVYVLDTRQGSDPVSLWENLAREPLVEAVSPDYRARIAVDPPDDPHFQFQYALHNTGQVYHPDQGLAGTAGSDIAALDGWDWTRGSEDVTIAIIDSGVAVDHEDLKNKIVAGYNFIDDNYDTYDSHGHGTFVASIAAAETGNGTGMAGTSWYGKIMPLKVADSEGYASYLAMAAAIRFAADNDARVINISMGGANPSFILEDACLYAFQRGCVITVSTGNEGSSVLYPAAYDDYCLAVAATDATDARPGWSNFGPQVDVAAPGVQVFGALFDPERPGEKNLYGYGSGTSCAAPYVAGAAALVMGYKPSLTNQVIMKLIKYTADDVNRAFFPGVDEFLGYGRINLGRLLGPFDVN